MDNGSSVVWDLVTQRSLSLRTLFCVLGVIVNLLLPFSSLITVDGLWLLGLRLFCFYFPA